MVCRFAPRTRSNPASAVASPANLNWLVEPARPGDLPAITELVEAVGGDLEDLLPEQFLVGRVGSTGRGKIVGCCRLKPYSGFHELASLAVDGEWRNSGVGRSLVAGLVAWYEGPIYLICEDDVVDFFRKFGFVLIPMPEMPTGLQAKWQRYVDQLGHINVMRRYAD